jgi:hypothetical protein
MERPYRGFTIRLRPSGQRGGWQAVWFDTQYPATGKRGETATCRGRRAKRQAVVQAITAIDRYHASLLRTLQLPSFPLTLAQALELEAANV